MTFDVAVVGGIAGDLAEVPAQMTQSTCQGLHHPPCPTSAPTTPLATSSPRREPTSRVDSTYGASATRTGWGERVARRHVQAALAITTVTRSRNVVIRTPSTVEFSTTVRIA